MSSGWRQSDGQGTIIVETFFLFPSHANNNAMTGWLLVSYYFYPTVSYTRVNTTKIYPKQQ